MSRAWNPVDAAPSSGFFNDGEIANLQVKSG
jgi:hypothetical protein